MTKQAQLEEAEELLAWAREEPQFVRPVYKLVEIAANLRSNGENESADDVIAELEALLKGRAS